MIPSNSTSYFSTFFWVCNSDRQLQGQEENDRGGGKERCCHHPRHDTLFEGGRWQNPEEVEGVGCSEVGKEGRKAKTLSSTALHG